MKKINNYIFIIIFIISGCGVYSFTGASISSESKTVSVEYFINKANTVQPILSQTFTEKLKDYLLEQTNLTLNTEKTFITIHITKAPSRNPNQYKA